MLLVKDTITALAFLFLSLFFSEMWPGPGVATAQESTNPRMRSLATSVFYITGSIGSPAPLLLGALNEWFKIPAPYGNTHDPTYPMLIIVAGAYFIAAIGFVITTIFIKKSSAVTYIGVSKPLLTPKTTVEEDTWRSWDEPKS